MSDVASLNPRPVELVGTLPDGEHVISTIEYDGSIIVACSHGVFILKDGVFKELLIVKDGGGE
jgi:hypothetical protein